MSLVCAPDHYLAGRGNVCLADLRGLEVIGFDSELRIRRRVDRALQEHGVESAVFAIAQHLPLTGVVAVFLFFLITTFFLTSANSAALGYAEESGTPFESKLATM